MLKTRGPATVHLLMLFSAAGLCACMHTFALLEISLVETLYNSNHDVQRELSAAHWNSESLHIRHKEDTQ